MENLEKNSTTNQSGQSVKVYELEIIEYTLKKDLRFSTRVVYSKQFDTFKNLLETLDVLMMKYPSECHGYVGRKFEGGEWEGLVVDPKEFTAWKPENYKKPEIEPEREKTLEPQKQLNFFI